MLTLVLGVMRSNSCCIYALDVQMTCVVNKEEPVTQGDHDWPDVRVQAQSSRPTLSSR